jgi:anti-anti-sigma factor
MSRRSRPCLRLVWQRAAVVPGVELRTSEYDCHVAVALRDELDITCAAEAEAAITALLARGHCLVIEMSALDFIDCSSLGALLRVQGQVRPAAAMWYWPRRSRTCGGCWP